MPPAKSPAARAARLSARQRASANSLSDHSSSQHSLSQHSLHEGGLAERLPSLGQLIPSGKSVLLGLALLVLACGAYVAALETSVFAVRTIEIRGATPQIRAEATQALSGELGRSLLRVDGADLDRRLSTLPGVSSLQYDRSFPNTLRVTIRAERPVLVLRRGRDAFLVSTTGRVLRTLAHPHLSSLPRVWLPSHTPVGVGARLQPGAGQGAAVALASLRGVRLPAAVHDVRVDGQELTVVLSSGFELRLGDAGDVRLKLAVARRIFRIASIGPTSVGYLDVSVPERPVLNINSQVGG